ncbi:MAG TPA: SIS domain-containing protein, partial [Cryptosporangiaceae bacterium]|nr:SIS domain-containing protein [Cryptosporangiaceae bacterium]
ARCRPALPGHLGGRRAGLRVGGGMSSRMRAEIEEQPAVLDRTLRALLPQLPALRQLAAETRQVLFVARGSSDHAAVYGRYLCEVHAGRLGTLAAPSVATAYRRRLDLDGVLAVGLSQSGHTEEIVDALGWARECGARTVAVTNTAGSPLTGVAEVSLVTEAGEERAVPATKTYTAALLALAVLGVALGPYDGGFAAVLRRVPEAVAEVLAAPGDVQAMAEAMAGAVGAVVSGRGYAYSTALELALKLKEACYLNAAGLSYADLLHGPMAVLDADTPALLVAADEGPMTAAMVGLAGLARKAGAPVYGIGGGDRLSAVCDLSLAGTSLPEDLAPIALVVPGQLLAEALARRLGIDPDSPRGLSKVTQTRS